MSKAIIKAIGPREVGGRYHSHYWGQDYTVLDIVTDRFTFALTVKWEDGRTTTHGTAWDARDKVVA